MIRYTEIKNRKNHTLRAMLNLPDGVSHPPVVLNLHGFGGSLSGYKYAHTHLARVLEANGIACLRFDFYGCGESDGEFEEMTFTGLLEDTAAPKLNPYGLILMCPGAGMWNGCKEKADFFKNQGMTFADMEGLKFGLDFNYDLATYSPFEDAKGYDGKVLILRGTEDNLVDDKTCETYLEGYNGTFVKIPKGNHNFASIPAREACESEILNFVKSIL